MRVMIIRNINPDHGMCGGAKALVWKIGPTCVEIDLFTGGRSWSREFILWPPLRTTDKDPTLL